MNKQEKVTNKQSCQGEIGLHMLGLFGDGRAHLGPSRECWNESNDFHWLAHRQALADLTGPVQGSTVAARLTAFVKRSKNKGKRTLFFSVFSFHTGEIGRNPLASVELCHPRPPNFLQYNLCFIICVPRFSCINAKKVFCYFISTY